MKKMKKKNPFFFNIPIGVLTDSYKATHFAMYPKANKMVAYGEFRNSFEKNKDDDRIVLYGIRYFVENYLEHRWTIEDVERSEHFYKTHNVGNTPFLFPKDLFLKFIKENNGYFPIKLEALPDGTVCHVHTPVFQITAEKEFARLVTFFETLLCHVWYPSCVATLSRMSKDYIQEAFDKSVDDSSRFLLNSRLHDFGFRGVTTLEQSMIGGVAHLLNFEGSDTMSACYYAQYHLNGGRPVGTSIPATEHSIMTSWKTEKEAILNTIDVFGSGLFATVMDSYDYDRALNVIVPQCKEAKEKKGGFWVMRPDSGDPVTVIVQAMKAGEKTFGVTKNSKGFKVLNGCSAIQGDGINKDTIKAILNAVHQEGFSAQNVAFGMGGGLLQKVNRDTMGFAVKLNFVEYADGAKRDVMKMPKSDPNKISLPGILRVRRGKDGQELIFPRDPNDHTYEEDDLLRPVYDCKPIPGVFKEEFSDIKVRVERDWNKSPKKYDPISKEMRTKISHWTEAQKKLLSENN